MSSWLSLTNQSSMRLSAFLSVCTSACVPAITHIEVVPEAMLRALDVGCGDGLSTRELSHRFPHHLVHGIDRDPLAIRMARRNFPQGLFQRKDLFDLSSVRPEFHVIQMKNLVDDIDDVDGTIHRIRRLLRPKGVLILSEGRHADKLGIFYRSCSLSIGKCRECIINDEKTEFIFYKC